MLMIRELPLTLFVLSYILVALWQRVIDWASKLLGVGGYPLLVALAGTLLFVVLYLQNERFIRREERENVYD